ncbi:MAG: hypothetical protein GXY33_09920 [Phycisphaerae bacterium]|nr:hypothetical protein [Phycisphaerae bacterium]
MSGASQSDYRSRLRRYQRRRRSLTALIAGVIALVIWIVSRLNGPIVGGPLDDYQRYHGKSFRCVKVVDGDTIDIEIPDPKAEKFQAYTRLRLWGIDTPELAHHGQPAAYFGLESAEFARKLMQGKMVRLELVPDETRGYYGRLLTYIFLPDERLYNRLAIELGYAYADPRYPHPRREEFLELEAQARDRLAGLWRGVEPDQLPKWYRPKRIERFWEHRRAAPAAPGSK